MLAIEYVLRVEGSGGTTHHACCNNFAEIWRPYLESPRRQSIMDWNLYYTDIASHCIVSVIYIASMGWPVYVWL